jgi:hypothetical protein
MGDIRDEWRLQAIEQKAERAHGRLYELDAIRSDMASLERAARELSSTCDGLRYELQDALRRVELAESMIRELQEQQP